MKKLTVSLIILTTIGILITPALIFSESKHFNKNKLYYSDHYLDEIGIKLNIEEQPVSPESIVPKPQKIEMLSGLSVIIDSKWKIVADLSNEYESFTANYLKNKILESFSLDLDIIDISKITVANNHISAMRSNRKNKITSSRKIIVIGNPNNNLTIARMASLEGIDVNSEIQGNFNQGYILQIKPEKVLILSDSTTGTFYGMISLTWLLKTQGDSITLPHTKITDWPDLGIRGFYGAGDYLWEGEMLNTTKDRKEWIEILTKYKYNLYTHSLSSLQETSSEGSINKEVEMEEFLRKRHFYPTAPLTPLSLRYYNDNLHEGVRAQNISLKFNDFDYAVPIESDDDILKNPGLEDDVNSDNVPDYWIFEYQEPPHDYWSMECSESHSGGCSVKLTLNKDLTGTITSSAYFKQYVFQEIKLPTDKTYLLTFWAKKKENSNNGRNPQFTVVLKDADGNYQTKSVLIKEVDNKWREYSIAFSTANNYTTMYVYSRAQGTAPLELWIDDFEVIEISEDNVLMNPSLENDVNEDEVPDYWLFTDQKIDDYWSMDYSQSHSGVCSAKLNLQKDLTGTDTSSSYLMQEVYRLRQLPRDKTYLLTFWAKKKEDSNNGKNPQFTVVLKDKDGNYQTKSVLIKEVDNEWREYSIVFSTANNYTAMYVYARAQGTAPLELWIDDFEIRLLDDELLNVIRTPDTELQVWNIDETIKYREGVDYALEEEENFNLVNPLLGKKTRIKKIPSGSIPEGGEIVIDYDFIVNFQQDGDEYITLADPLIYELYDKYMLKYTMANLNLDYVFIGMDEIRGFNRDSRSKKLGLENYELLAQFTNKIIDMIHSYNPDTKVLIWDDMFSPYHNGGDENYQIPYGGEPGATSSALDLVNKDNVMLVSWWYSASDSKGKMANSPGLYNELNLKFLGGPWDNVENIKYWSYLCYKNNAAGMIGHEFYNRIGGVPIVADYSWNTVKSYSE